MKLITEIHDEDSITSPISTQGIHFYVRRAARAILMNERSEIALMYVAQEKCHKLPGGGIEDNESITGALRREMLEEVGAEIEIVSDLGLIIEYRNKQKLVQISYCYMCKVIGNLVDPIFTEEELSAGFQIKWVNLDEAITMVANDHPERYALQYIRKRDLAFLQAAKKWSKQSLA
jgi:8-oxo-dGTP diphosphatase